MDKKAKQRIREERRADQARYDEGTRLIEARLAYYRRLRAERERESS